MIQMALKDPSSASKALPTKLFPPTGWEVIGSRFPGTISLRRLYLFIFKFWWFFRSPVYWGVIYIQWNSNGLIKLNEHTQSGNPLHNQEKKITKKFSHAPSITIPPAPLAPGDHQWVFCPYNYAFSKMSLKWSNIVHRLLHLLLSLSIILL